jgi:hypothetical protein
LRLRPVCAGGCDLEGGGFWPDEVAGPILHEAEFHLVLENVGVFDVANRPFYAVHVFGNAFIALAADTGS